MQANACIEVPVAPIGWPLASSPPEGSTVDLPGLIGLARIVSALFHVMRGHGSTLAKAICTVALILFPFIGFIAWLIFCPRSAR